MIQIIKGKVIKGKQLGRTIGFPTVNVNCNKKSLEDGTYKINIIVDGLLYKGAGTFRKDISLFEGHIFNFDKNIYGKIVEIIVLDKIRNNKKISSLEEVKALIENDVKIIKNIKNNVLTFGTFDKLHPGHEYYLNSAKKYGDKLITIIATDKNVNKFKSRYPDYNSKKRIENLKELKISDEIILGDENNPLKWIQIYNPSVICLGYDQISFSDKLENYIKKNKLNIQIIRINPFKETIYKSSLI